MARKIITFTDEFYGCIHRETALDLLNQNIVHVPEAEFINLRADPHQSLSTSSTSSVSKSVFYAVPLINR